MRLTDDRYASERAQFELALRMIRHEARTRTIRECTGLSDDRIRKAVRHLLSQQRRQQRQATPGQIAAADQRDSSRSPRHQLQATTLVALYCAGSIAQNRRRNPGTPELAATGRRIWAPLCRAFETYLTLHRQPCLNFEWAWNLLQSISYNDELYLAALPALRCALRAGCLRIGQRDLPGRNRVSSCPGQVHLAPPITPTIE